MFGRVPSVDEDSSYRVNLFGFPNAPGLTDQNLGLLDQRLAYASEFELELV